MWLSFPVLFWWYCLVGSSRLCSSVMPATVYEREILHFMKPTEAIYWIFIRPTFFEESVLFLFHLFSLHLLFLQPFLPDYLYLDLLFLPRCKPLGQGMWALDLCPSRHQISFHHFWEIFPAENISLLTALTMFESGLHIRELVLWLDRLSDLYLQMFWESKEAQ